MHSNHCKTEPKAPNAFSTSVERSAYKQYLKVVHPHVGSPASANNALLAMAAAEYYSEVNDIGSSDPRRASVDNYGSSRTDLIDASDKKESQIEERNLRQHGRSKSMPSNYRVPTHTLN